VDLTALVEQMGETYAPDFEANGHRFEVDAGPGACWGLPPLRPVRCPAP
jgi:hypothetical protein